MKRAALAVLLLALVGAAFLFFSGEEPAPRSEPSPAIAPLPVIADPAPVVVSPLPDPLPRGGEGDGGRLGLLTIALEREGKPEPGPRLVLRNAEGLEGSRTTDVMGLATFELPPGSWLVMAPAELKGQAVEVTLEPRRVTLTMPPLRRVEGQVVDETGAPVVNLAVIAGGPRFVLSELGERLGGSDAAEAAEVARTGEDGRFSFTTIEEALELSASQGEAQASLQLHPPASGVVLRLQPTAWLLVVPFSPTQVLLSLSSRTGTEVHQLSGPTKVRVPVGELDARALTVSRGQLLRATRHLVVKAGQTNRLDLEFVAAPAVSGVVMDAQGAPLAGVTVGLKLAPSNPGTPPRAQESALTDSRGHFELVPRLIRGGDPVYEVHVLPPWREQGRVLVRLGDQPLSITAEPAP